MSYDIAAKVLIEKCRHEILRRFLGLAVADSVLIEDLPQETASLRRSDFPILVTEQSGRRRLVVIEVQSHWEPAFPLRLLEYRCRHMLRHDVEALTCVLLLRPADAAVDYYEDGEVSYHYRLIKVYDLDAAAVVAGPTICLLPFVPLMRGGLALTAEADRLIYAIDLPRGDKADMLTGMAILSGLVSGELAARLVGQRRDIMIESVAYELIKQEGRQEGRQEGLHQGSIVGRIHHTQVLLGLPVADAAELASKDPAVLRALASELDARLKDQLARLRGRPSEN